MCVAAGSRYVAGHHIVCSDHFKRDKKNITHSHINTNWCFVCSLGEYDLMLSSFISHIHCAVLPRSNSLDST